MINLINYEHNNDYFLLWPLFWFCFLKQSLFSGKSCVSFFQGKCYIGFNHRHWPVQTTCGRQSSGGVCWWPARGPNWDTGSGWSEGAGWGSCRSCSSQCSWNRGSRIHSERKPSEERVKVLSAGSLPMLLSVCVDRHPVGGGGGSGRAAVPHAGKLLAGLWSGAACCRHCVCKGPRIRLNSAW